MRQQSDGLLDSLIAPGLSVNELGYKHPLCKPFVIALGKADHTTHFESDYFILRGAQNQHRDHPAQVRKVAYYHQWFFYLLD